MRPKKLVLGIVALVTAVSTAFALNLPAPFFTIQVLAQTANERKAEAERLFRQARQEFNNNKFEAALQSWQQALHIYREIKDYQSEGAALGGIGLAYLVENDGKTPRSQELGCFYLNWRIRLNRSLHKCQNLSRVYDVSP